MKIAIIGGGSTYTPELINGFLDCWETFPLEELWLMDIQPDRLDIVGEFAKCIVTARGAQFDIILSDDQREAVQGASYVITQLRVGMMEARRQDEYLGRRHNLVGQETTGIGGMAKALRTIPVILGIAEDMQELAPGATLVNFTNPAGLITEALSRYAPDVPSVGVCNVAITMKMQVIDEFEKLTGNPINPKTAILDTLGLNHLTWHRGFTIDGIDIWPQVLIAYREKFETSSEPEWEAWLIESLRMIPNYYLGYYYHTEREIASQGEWPPSRAEEVMALEVILLAQYAEPGRVEPPDDLVERGGAYYSTLATQLLNAHYNDLGEIHVLNVPHGGAVHGWPKDWVLEIPCRVDAQGIHPLPAPPLPALCFGLLAQVKSYELLTVEAAVHADREALLQAILAHPLGPGADRVETLAEDLISTNRNYLPQF
jgi:6-phospho-beta-glucosidase